ncbi:MAG: hypothetical protein AAF552_17690 [Pseudomonadota bacterium]
MRRNKGEKASACPLCGRSGPLTFHHLIPKKLHRRKRFRKRYSREELAQGVHICRLCHNGVHRLFDEMTLGQEMNSLERLQADESLQRHVRWVSKQRRRSS